RAATARVARAPVVAVATHVLAVAMRDPAAMPVRAATARAAHGRPAATVARVETAADVAATADAAPVAKMLFFRRAPMAPFFCCCLLLPDIPPVIPSPEKPLIRR